LLKSERSLIASAVDELLRYNIATPFVHRYVTEDMEIGGKLLRKGQLVFLGLGAANRDPAEFEQPDVFDITRRDNRHIAFGRGHHYCIGASLAKRELERALLLMIERKPQLRLNAASPPELMCDNIVLRGFHSLSLCC